MVMMNLLETENDEMKPEKQRRRNVVDETASSTLGEQFNSTFTTMHHFKTFQKINLSPVQRKNSKTLFDYCALIQRRKNKATNAQLGN